MRRVESKTNTHTRLCPLCRRRTLTTFNIHYWHFSSLYAHTYTSCARLNLILLPGCVDFLLASLNRTFFHHRQIECDDIRWGGVGRVSSACKDRFCMHVRKSRVRKEKRLVRARERERERENIEWKRKERYATNKKKGWVITSEEEEKENEN